MGPSFKKKIVRGDLLIGTIISLPSPEIAEILSSSGLDWLFLDLEHSALGIRDAQTILQAAEQQTPCVIRVPSMDEVWVKKALDTGCAGVIVPQVQTADAAQTAVRLCKYPPDGIRGVGIARAQGYGRHFQEYTATANREIAVIVQIEHIDAVHNIEEIIKVPGIDCLFVGPYDLSASMGKTGHVTDPEVQEAISHVKQCAQRENISLGIFGASAEAAEPYIQSGYTLIAVSMDTMILGDGVTKMSNALK